MRVTQHRGTRRRRDASTVVVGVLTLLAALAVPAAGSTVHPAATARTVSAVDATAAQHAVDALAAVRDPGRRDGDLSMALLDLFHRRDALPPTFQQSGSDQFGRPTGMTGMVQTANFVIRYSTDPASGDFATDAFAQETAAVFEEVYAIEIAGQGWSRPADDGTRGGDNRIDVYLMDLVAQGAYGFASPDADAGCDPTRCTGLHGWMGIENDYDGYPPDPSGALRATVAHEFHHLIQFNEAGLTDPWFFEATATWEESVVYPDIDARTFYIDAFTATADQPLTLTDGAHEYGAYVVMRWFADRFGPDVLRDAWRAALDADQHALAGLDAALRVRGTTLAAAYGRFAADSVGWNVDGFPRDVINGTTTTYPEVPRRDVLSDGQMLPVALDHTAYAVHPVQAADAMGAAISTGTDIAASVSVVAIDGAGVRVASATTDRGQATATLTATTGADLFVVVANTDIVSSPFVVGGTREYAADGAVIDLQVSSDLAVTPLATALVDGGRLQAQGPVAQAVATSQSLFADGSAGRVVLATSERFPDALAGAALAGADGPILFTPFADTLDPAVRAEITRVTGGNGMVLVLGGAAAVSQGAAAEARSAAGDVSCAAPFPADCRYAGSGREATAALIAQTVVAEHAPTQALIARGDAFADALTGGAYAARAGVPVLLTPSDLPNTATRAFLDAHPELTDVVVLGGTAAVDEPTAVALRATGRAAGAERTATSVAIAEQLWGTVGGGTGGVILVNVRAEDAWQTALAAAVASAVFDAPQLGVESPPAGLSPAVGSHLGGRAGPVQAYGTTDAVSGAQLDAAVAAHR